MEYEIRVCRDDGLVLFAEPRVQFSRQQVSLLLALHAASGRLPLAEVHNVLWGESDKPRSGSQRAALSRSLRRWVELGIVTREGQGVALTRYGKALGRAVHLFVKKSREPERWITKRTGP